MAPMPARANPEAEQALLDYGQALADAVEAALPGWVVRSVERLMIARIVEAMPGAEMRVFLRDQNVDLTDCFLNNGYRSIPIVVFFDKDWNEVGRWIERAGTATQKSFAIRAVTLDVATEDKKDAAMAEFRKQVQGTYDGPADKSMWRETAKEVRAVLEQRLGLVGKK